MSYNVYDQVFPIEKIRKGIIDGLFERYSEEEKNMLYESFLKERMGAVKYLLMPGPDFNEFKLAAYLEHKSGEEVDIKNHFNYLSNQVYELNNLLVAVNADDRSEILYRMKNISKETLMVFGVNRESILKGDTIDYSSEEFLKLKSIAQDINLLGTKRSHTEREYSSELKGKWHLIDNFMISYKNFIKEVDRIYPEHKRFNVMGEYIQLSLNQMGIKECDQAKVRTNLMKKIFGINVFEGQLGDDIYFKALDINRNITVQMDALKSTSIYSFRKGENPNIGEAVEYFKLQYDLNEWEILYAIQQLGGYVTPSGVSIDNSNFVSIKLDNDFSISTIIHETLHNISINGGYGLMDEKKRGVGLNEAFTEYFAQKIFRNIRDDIDYKHDKSNACAYQSTIILIGDFLKCFEDELVMDYLKNGYKNSKTKDFLGQEEYDEIIDLIDKYHNMKTNYLLIEKVDDKVLLADPQKYFEDIKEENKEIMKEYYDLVVEIRQRCAQAVEKKQQYAMEENKNIR